MNRLIASLAKTEVLCIGSHQFQWRLPLETKIGLGPPIEIGYYLRIDRVKQTYTEKIQGIEADIAASLGRRSPSLDASSLARKSNHYLPCDAGRLN